MIEIRKEEYNSLLKTKSEAESLRGKVEQLEVEAKNKAIALDEERKKSKTKVDEYKKLLLEKESELEGIKNLIELWEDESFEEKMQTLKSWNAKYLEVLKQQEQAKKQEIETYVEFLWKDFMEEKSHFFDGLDIDKKTMLLAEFAKNKGFGKNENTVPKVSAHTDGAAPSASETTAFDKAMSSWASYDELLNTLDY